MRSFGGTSSDFIDLTSLAAFAPISAYSVFCAMRPASTASGFYTAITLGGGINWEVQLVRNGTNLEIYHQVQPSGLVFASDAGGLSAGTLARAGGAWNGSTLKVYRDGVEKNSTSATTILQNNFNANNSIGYQRQESSQYWNGQLGEIAFWNVALTAGEWAALGAGVSPAFIRPQSLGYYYPLIREVIDLRGITTPTVTGTSVADHCRVYRPWLIPTPFAITSPAAAVPTIGRRVEPPAVDAAWQSYLEAHAMPLATVHYPVTPPPPPPPPPAPPAATINPVQPPPIDSAWQQYLESWVHGMRPLKADPLPILPPTPLPQAGHSGKALLPKDPQADVVTRTFVNRSADILNSLMSQGRLVQVDGPSRQWAMTSGITASRPPAATDDFTTGALPGMTWVNTAAGTVYICSSNTTGAAVWLKLATA